MHSWRDIRSSRSRTGAARDHHGNVSQTIWLLTASLQDNRGRAYKSVLNYNYDFAKMLYVMCICKFVGSVTFFYERIVVFRMQYC